ncbi:MAG TPA: RDD family protein [Polyangia bacterium]|nr:RDD family protein [Polyangia bacterium]
MNQPNNPYQAPQADLNTGMLGDAPDNDLPDASLGLRFANFVIDGIIERVLFAVVGVAALRAMNPEGWGLMVGVLFALLFFVGYYVILEAAFGWTIGKLITGTRVVDDDGNKPAVLRVLGRTLARLIPFEVFSFLFANAGWHDSLSGTRVVKVRR